MSLAKLSRRRRAQLPYGCHARAAAADAARLQAGPGRWIVRTAHRARDRDIPGVVSLRSRRSDRSAGEHVASSQQRARFGNATETGAIACGLDRPGAIATALEPESGSDRAHTEACARHDQCGPDCGVAELHGSDSSGSLATRTLPTVSSMTNATFAETCRQRIGRALQSHRPAACCPEPSYRSGPGETRTARGLRRARHGRHALLPLHSQLDHEHLQPLVGNGGGSRR